MRWPWLRPAPSEGDLRAAYWACVALVAPPLTDALQAGLLTEVAVLHEVDVADVPAAFEVTDTGALGQ